MADQTAGTLSYVQQSTVATTVTLPTSIQASIANGKALIDFYQGFNSGALLQQTRFNVGGAIAANDEQVISIISEGSTVPKNYVNRASGYETLAQLVSDIADRINLEEKVVATPTFSTASNIGTISLTSAIGHNFTVSVAGSTGSVTLSTPASVQTGSGVAASNIAKIATFQVGYSIATNGVMQIAGNSATYYNGAGTPNISSSSVVNSFSHPHRIPTLVANQSYPG
jgi:hypothetical protein